MSGTATRPCGPRNTRTFRHCEQAYKFVFGRWQQDALIGPRRARIFSVLRGYARATFKKDMRVNIRMSSKDLDGLKKRALEEGIPYQTLMSSVLHKYVDARLVEKIV